MDLNYIKSVTQSILNSQFNSFERKKIVSYENRFNFCCPYCGDSSKNERAKRFNLYFNNLFMICFNCGKNTTFDKFAKDFNQQLDPNKKLEIINYLNTKLTYKDYEDVSETSFENLLNLSDITKIFSEGDFSISDFKPVQKGSIVYKYLLSRNITDNLHTNIFEAKYWYNSDRYENVICLLNRRGEKVLGIQIRNLKPGRKRMFKIFNYETLYKWINGVDDITHISLNQLIIYNKISYYFNILNVDFSDKITIFEGYLDSLFFPNSIGVVGTNTDTKILENNDVDIQFMYDNDFAGYIKSEEKIRLKFPVFLWKKLFENIVEKKNPEDPYSLYYRVSKIKDLNGLAELVENPFKKLNLQEFFSKDIFDIKYLPKVKYRYIK